MTKFCDGFCLFKLHVSYTSKSPVNRFVWNFVINILRKLHKTDIFWDAPKTCTIMYIDPSSGHSLLSLNLPFKLVLRSVWSENAALFERLLEIHSNPPILYYGFNIQLTNWILSNGKFYYRDVIKNDHYPSQGEGNGHFYHIDVIDLRISYDPIRSCFISLIENTKKWTFIENYKQIWDNLRASKFTGQSSFSFEH